jgi:hypothetical protein
MCGMCTITKEVGAGAQVGRQEPVMVLRVDEDKGCIDVTTVFQGLLESCLCLNNVCQKWALAKQVGAGVRRWADKNQ